LYLERITSFEIKTTTISTSSTIFPTSFKQTTNSSNTTSEKCQLNTSQQPQTQMETLFVEPQPLMYSSTNASTLVLSPENHYSQLILTLGGLFNNLCEEGMANPLTVNDPAFDSQFNAQQKALDLLNDPIFQSSSSTSISSNVTNVVSSSNQTNEFSKTLESSSWMEQNASLDDLLFGTNEELPVVEEKLETICSSSRSPSLSPSPSTTNTNTAISSSVVTSGPKKRGRKPLVDANGQPCAKKPRGTPSKPADDNAEEMAKYLRLRESNNLSAVRSRLKRKVREQENSEKLRELERQNTELRAQLEAGRNKYKRLAKLLKKTI